MNTECLRISDQLRRAFAGEAWHGPSLKELLTDVRAKQAHTRSVAHAHSIWELVLHIQVWVQAAADAAARGVPMPKIVGTERDWSSVSDIAESTWCEAVTAMFESASLFAQAIEAFADSRLGETVPGRRYDFYYLFHGVIQHSLYHAGQIALLKKSLSDG